MKKIFAFFLILFVGITLFSCNNKKDPSKESNGLQSGMPKSPASKNTFRPDPTCIGLANIYFINKTEALNMIDHFNKEFHKKRKLPASMKKFKDSIWIDGSVINAFSDFFDAHPSEFDGLRIVSVSYENDSSNIFLVPTLPDGSKHKESWATRVQPPAVNYQFSNFNSDTSVVNPLIRKFRKLFRIQSNVEDINSTKYDSLSAKIWLSSCVFNLLSDTIKNSGNKLDGVMVYFAAYAKFLPNPGTVFQKRANQSTVILVPTNPNGSGGHSPDWEAVKSKFFSLKLVPPDPGGYNHGSLCPQLCD